VIASRPFGRTGVSLPELGLGGEGVLRSWGQASEAADVIQTAFERGLRFFDSAPAYDGSEDYLGASLAPVRGEVFLATKTAARSKSGSARLLAKSLERLRTDYLDLWQLHDVQTSSDLRRIFGIGGAIEALDEAKVAGAVRFTGITGHHHPDVLIKALREYPFDSVMIPLNPADHVRLPFRQVLEEAQTRGVAVIAMKVFSTGLLVELQRCLAHDALRYVWSCPGVSIAIVGCRSPDEVRANARSADAYLPMAGAAQKQLEAACAYRSLTPYKAARVSAIAQK
jgi:aryl-alcohol dehydrogenase-like predicted oxidoreductase